MKKKKKKKDMKGHKKSLKSGKDKRKDRRERSKEKRNDRREKSKEERKEGREKSKNKSARLRGSLSWTKDVNSRKDAGVKCGEDINGRDEDIEDMAEYDEIVEDYISAGLCVGSGITCRLSVPCCEGLVCNFRSRKCEATSPPTPSPTKECVQEGGRCRLSQPCCGKSTCTFPQRICQIDQD